MGKFTVKMEFNFDGKLTERDKDKIHWHFQDDNHENLFDNLNPDMIDSVAQNLKIEYEE